MDIYEIKANNVGSDIKAEIIAADLVENGVDVDDIVITPAGLAERFHSRDILHIEARQDRLGLRDLLNIAVSREGLYNSLPEAIFHVFDKGKKANAAGFVEDYKKHKAEEEAARQFFLVFEKEIFRLRTLLELSERQSMSGFSEQFKSDLYLNLWPELKDVDEIYLPALIFILPIAHKVIGNTLIVETLFGYMLNQQVSIRHSNVTRVMINNTDSQYLGRNYLGVNTVIGNETADFTPLVEIRVGPLKKGDLVSLMPGGEARKTLDLTCKYLFPALTDINVTLLLDSDCEKLILSADKSDGVLGFTSRI